jgi:hypothetical protein
MVVERTWPGVEFSQEVEGGVTKLTTATFEVRVPSAATSLSGAGVYSPAGDALFVYSSLPSGRSLLPTPAEFKKAYAISDVPRIIPPAWGATPPPPGTITSSDPLYQTSGWDFRNDAPDVYVFVNAGQGYIPFRKEFLRLTGPIPMVPMFILGFANSRYWAYTDKEFLQIIDEYRTRGVPLDIQVVDTDWRLGEYDLNTTYFPDLAGFFKQAHDRHVKIMFNDHPQGGTIQPASLQYRYDNLTKYLSMGLDYWWYDRNWDGIMTGPLPNIERDSWGQAVFTDTHARLRPTERPILMSMRSDIDFQITGPAGGLVYTDMFMPIKQTHPASHRYPINWTGDISCDFNALRQSVITTVADGPHLLTWVHQDIAGYNGSPTDELYARFIQWGLLSPASRVHGCGSNNFRRMPWLFSADVSAISTAYIKLRYRLMPTIYTAARRNHDDGTPLVERCDLEWPDLSAAVNNEQYLFCNDILVHPVTAAGATMTQAKQVPLWVPPGDWLDPWTGEVRQGPASITIDSKLYHVPMLIRRGAIVCLAPDMLYTSEKPWDPVTVDVFPAASGSVTRELYEDDGKSLGYRSGQFTRTPITVERDANGIALTLGAAEGDFPEKLTNRAWIVRLHLDAAQAPQPLSVQGVAVELGQGTWKGAQPQARQLEPLDAQAAITSANFPIPFGGEGSRPAPASGKVIEVWLPSAAPATPRTVTMGNITLVRSDRQLHYGNSANQFRVKVSPSNPADLVLLVPVQFSLVHGSAGSSAVSIELCTLKGERVKTIFDGFLAAGYHTLKVQSGILAAGSYLCTLRLDGAVQERVPVAVAR